MITPPVAISLYAANGLSGAGLWESGLAAVKLAATGYIIPFMFVFAPSLLLIGTWHDILWSVSTALIGVICLAASLHGYLLRNLYFWSRVILFVGALGLLSPGLLNDGIGLACLLLIVVKQTILRPEKNLPQL